MQQARFALTRDIPASFANCIQFDKPRERVDVDRAREQHRLYRATLEGLGLTVLRIAADDRYPDSCFVEDPAVVIENQAVILNVGAATRVGEEAAVRVVLARHKRTIEITPPATLEGGDVLSCGDTIYVGQSTRSNREGFEAFGRVAARLGYRAVPVEVDGVLHLKSACTVIGGGRLVVAPNHVDTRAFAGLEMITVPDEELAAANCLALNGKVIMQKGFTTTHRRIASCGFEVVEVDLSEFRKAGGSVTCLSLIW